MAKNDNPAAEGVVQRQKAKEDGVAEYYAREAASKPTPTQRENDLARVGALDIDEKEPDGSEPEVESQRRVMEGKLPGGNPYDTRAFEAGASKKPAPAPAPAKPSGPSPSPSPKP